MKKYRERWNIYSDAELKELIIGKGAFLNSPFGFTEDNLIDFRGYNFSNKELHSLCIKDLDFSYSIFSNSRIHKSIFKNVLFNNTKFEKSTEHGNTFNNCSFNKTTISRVHFGYDGSQYNNCYFDYAKILSSIFIRAEFNYCFFSNIKINNVEFNASSFEYCTFSGLLNGVWFMGEFQVPKIDNKKFGKPRLNKMLNVDFNNAELKNLTFSSNCDLSTVILPKSGNYTLIDNLKEYIDEINKKKALQSQSIQYEIEKFIKLKSRFPNQKNTIINFSELVERFKFSIEFVEFLKILLNKTPINN